MARFVLTKPHVLNTSRGPVQIEAGAEISSGDFVNFSATAHMTPLDDEAEQLLLAEVNRLMSTYTMQIYSGLGGEIVGFGSAQNLPAIPTPHAKDKQR
jgi:hypothetical protein